MSTTFIATLPVHVHNTKLLQSFYRFARKLQICNWDESYYGQRCLQIVKVFGECLHITIVRKTIKLCDYDATKCF